MVTLFVSFCAISFAQEQITITTYYPAPFGVYRELQTQTDGEIITIGGDATSPIIHLNDTDPTDGGAGDLRPAIVYSTAGNLDFNIVLWGNDRLRVRGGVTEFANDDNSPAIIRVGEVWYCTTLP